MVFSNSFVSCLSDGFSLCVTLSEDFFINYVNGLLYTKHTKDFSDLLL